jgi:hypothetical protein
MAIVEVSALKAKFEPGDSPKSSDFINLIDTLAALPALPDLNAFLDAAFAGVSTSEVGYLNGVTSSIQTQIDSKAPSASPTFTGTVSGVTKTHVGLENVDNTADTAKPISTATQTALDLKLASTTAATTYETITNVALKAPLASPALTGTPTAPLATTGTNTTQIATTSFVQQELSILTSGAPAALNTLDELAAALGDDSSYAATITTALGLKAPLNSPTFTGTPTLPTGTIATTQTAADSTTAVATTAFVTTADNLKANLAGPTFTGNVTLPSTTSIGNVTSTEIEYIDGVTSSIQTQLDSKDSSEQSMTIALSDEATPITAGNSKLTMRAPFAMTLTKIPRASLKTASTSGIPTVDINENGTTILSTKLTIDANEKTSTTAATAAVLSDTSIADDAEITFDIDVSGTGAIGLKVTLYYKKV